MVKVALIGTYSPKRCGIACFTEDLFYALKKSSNQIECVDVIAIDDSDEHTQYPSEVLKIISKNDSFSYFEIANFLNKEKYDVCIVQHEFGLFGGECGSFITYLLQTLNIPVLITLHSVPVNPSQTQLTILRKLGELSHSLIVLAQCAKSILTNTYYVKSSKIKFIPHGVPDLNEFKERENLLKFGSDDKQIIMTFGLLGPNKGIEYMIKAMKYIVKDRPQTVYVIIGKTHPNIIKNEGEKYRNLIQNQIGDLDLSNNIFLINKYVNKSELLDYLKEADLYVTPYPNFDQISSGTLSYAMACGLPIISTPYIYAKEMLGENRGVMVPFNNVKTLVKSITRLLGSSSLRMFYGNKVLEFSKSMTWNQIGHLYSEIIHGCANTCIEKNKQNFRSKIIDQAILGN